MSHTHTLDSQLSRTRATTARAGNVALWVLQILGAAMFVMAGAMKLSGAADAVALFDAIGIGQWFRYVTGGIELLAALLLLVPRFAGVAALILAAVMVGAVFTELFVIERNPMPAATLLALASVIAYGRRDRTRALVRRP